MDTENGSVMVPGPYDAGGTGHGPGLTASSLPGLNRVNFPVSYSEVTLHASSQQQRGRVNGNRSMRNIWESAKVET